MKKGTRTTEKIKADVMADIIPDAEWITEKYSQGQIELLFAFVNAIKSGLLK